MGLQKLWALPVMVLILSASGSISDPNRVGGESEAPAAGAELGVPGAVLILDEEGVPLRINTEMVSTGTDHTCALTPAGRAYCWGSGEGGKLGNGSTSDRHTPMAVSGNQKFVVISAGGTHTCALTEEGEAWCWGAGDKGQLGTGSTEGSNKPVKVAGNHAFVEISAGEDHTCALTENGTAYCWGSGQNGKLGTGSTRQVLEPTPVSGDHVFVNISAGAWHTCGVEDDGVAFCWGTASYGRLGAGEGVSTNQSKPVEVALVKNFVSIATGSAHTCGVTDNDAVYCWGRNNGNQLGDGTKEDRWLPIRVPVNFKFTQVAAAHRHTCAVTDVGKIYCWGLESWGRLGTGTLRNMEKPDVEVSGRHQFVSVSISTYHSCAVTTRSELYCWGRNNKGQLGVGTAASRSTPGLVGGRNID